MQCSCRYSISAGGYLFTRARSRDDTTDCAVQSYQVTAVITTREVVKGRGGRNSEHQTLHDNATVIVSLLGSKPYIENLKLVLSQVQVAEFVCFQCSTSEHLVDPGNVGIVRQSNKYSHLDVDLHHS